MYSKSPDKVVNLSDALKKITSLNLLDISQNDKNTIEILKCISDLCFKSYVALGNYDAKTDKVEIEYEVKKCGYLQSFIGKEGSLFKTAFIDKKPNVKEDIKKEGYSENITIKHNNGVCFIVCPVVIHRKDMEALIIVLENKRCSPDLIEDINSIAKILSISLHEADLYKQVESSKETVRSLQDTLKEGVLLFSDKGKILSINNPVYKMLSLKKKGNDSYPFEYLQDFIYNPSKYSDSKIIYFFDPISLFNNTLVSGNTASGLLKINSDNRSTKYIRVYFNRISGSSQSQYNITLALRDVTRYRVQQEQLYTMYKTSMDIVKSDDAYSPLVDVANNAIDLLDAESAEIFYYDKAENSLNLMVAINSHYEVGTKIEVGKGAIGKAAKEHIPILANSRSHSPKNLLVLPLMKRNSLLGIISVGDNRKEKLFTGKDVSALVLFGAQAAFAIQNAINIRSISIQNVRLEALYKNIEEGITFIDSEHKIQDMNATSQIIWGYKLDDVKGMKLEDVIKKSIYKIQEPYDIKKLLDLIIQTKKGVPFHSLTLISANESVKFIECSYIPQKNEEGDVIGIIRVTRDVSKSKEIDQIKSDFVSIASHELRTPLTVINGYLNLFLEGYLGELTAEQKKFLDRIYNDTMDLTRLVEDLLNVSRIEGGRLKLNKSEFDIKSTILKVRDDLAYRAKSKNIQIKADINYDKQMVFADERKLIHVITNILDNAIKYTYKDGEVKIFSRVDKDDIIINILDNGVGIPLSYKNKIFTKFQRIPNPLSNQEGGTGLGLYISKGILTAHGGDIKYRKRKNNGSIFQLIIPINSKI